MWNMCNSINKSGICQFWSHYWNMWTCSSLRRVLSNNCDEKSIFKKGPMCWKRNWDHSELLLELLPEKKNLIWTVLVNMWSGMFHKRQKQPNQAFTGINNIADVPLGKKKTSLESLTVISNDFFPVIVFVAALTISGRMVFRVRQEPAPCAWARGSMEGLTGCENWPSDIEELKRSTTHTRIMSEVRSRFAALF